MKQITLLRRMYGIFANIIRNLCKLPNNQGCKMLVYVADGEIKAGGISDRFRGIISLYMLSKQLGVNFKVHMSEPFDISYFFEPNQHNWLLTQDELSLIYSEKATSCEMWSANRSPNVQHKDAIKILRNRFSRYQYVRCTTNLNIREDRKGVIFDELFRFSPLLQRSLTMHANNLDGNYIGVTFRFQQLLGDFVENDYPTLPINERIILLKKCEAKLLEIYEMENHPKILLTSDSLFFLNEMSNHKFVYFVNGEVLHVDYSISANPNGFLKSFLDYFLLTRASKLYSVIIDGMFDSGFPYLASVHGDIQLVRLYENNNN